MHNNQFRRAIWYLLPAIIVMVVFTFYPLVDAVIQSFNYNRTPDNYLFSIKTYQALFRHAEFRMAFRNTVLYTFVVTPISLIIAIGISSILASIKWLRSFFQTIFFIPYVTSAVAVAFTWAYMFNTNFGLVNMVLTNILKMNAIPWLTHPDYAMIAVIIFGVWRSLAFNILLMTTAILSIDPQYYKAAQIDGATGFAAFKSITLPLVSPTIAYLFTIGLINAFKVFNEVYAFIGPTSRAVNANTMVIFIFDQLWVSRDYSLASAASVVLLLFVLVLTAFSRWVAGKTNFYR